MKHLRFHYNDTRAFVGGIDFYLMKPFFEWATYTYKQLESPAPDGTLIRSISTMMSIWSMANGDPLVQHSWDLLRAWLEVMMRGPKRDLEFESHVL